MSDQVERGHEHALIELMGLSMFGAELSEALQTMTERLARAFRADDCVLVLVQDMSCYSAQRVADEVLQLLVPWAEPACEQPGSLIVPDDEPTRYRTLLGVPLASNQSLPFAWLVLCRRQPEAFAPEVRTYLDALAPRLSLELAWRLADERRRVDEQQVQIVSRVDPVLGVANRLVLEEDLTERVAACRRADEPLAAAVIDVDGLNLINKRHGYRAGDAVLAHIARIARQHAAPGDVLARYASDAIALLLPGRTASRAVELLTQMLTAIDATPVLHEDQAINLTLSAGIAELDIGDVSGAAALARATAARERARVTGEVVAVAGREASAAVAAAPDYAIGTTLGGVYQIRHEISRGGFGVVYRAEDVSLGRQTALKLLHADLARDTAFVDKFRAEAATLARIRNPNLVQVYAFGIEGQHVYMAMELVEGHGLDQRIASARARRLHIPFAEVADVIAQVGRALEAMHHARVLHRDVKPENVLVDRVHRRCALVDLGVAVPRGSEKQPAGTPGFTAPEVFGDAGETPATDVYSLGALAYELLTLEEPFGGGAPWEILQRQMHAMPVPPSKLREDLPRGVDDAVLRALLPDPQERPQSARELATMLGKLLASPLRERRAQPPAHALGVDLGGATTIRNRSTSAAAPTIRNRSTSR
jgi:serine/threonine-protein kinase